MSTPLINGLFTAEATLCLESLNLRRNLNRKTKSKLEKSNQYNLNTEEYKVDIIKEKYKKRLQSKITNLNK